MRRSAQVTAPLLAATALSLLTGCRRPEMQRCVDEHNNVVDDSLCQNQPNQPQQRPDGNGGYIPFFPYHYYYGGWGGYALGSQVGGGSYSPTPGRSYTSRGGFGSSFAEGGSHSSNSSSGSRGGGGAGA